MTQVLKPSNSCPRTKQTCTGSTPGSIELCGYAYYLFPARLRGNITVKRAPLPGFVSTLMLPLYARGYPGKDLIDFSILFPDIFRGILRGHVTNFNNHQGHIILRWNSFAEFFNSLKYGLKQFLGLGGSVLADNIP